MFITNKTTCDSIIIISLNQARSIFKIKKMQTAKLMYLADFCVMRNCCVHQQRRYLCVCQHFL